MFGAHLGDVVGNERQLEVGDHQQTGAEHIALRFVGRRKQFHFVCGYDDQFAGQQFRFEWRRLDGGECWYLA